MIIVNTYGQGQSRQNNPPKHNENDCPPGQVRIEMDGHWKCEPMTTLPITLLSFTSKRLVDGSILVQWKVTDIVNHDYYTVEWSEDGKVWKILGSAKDIKLIHNTRYKNNYYRLLSVDLDGTINTYKIIYQSAEQQPLIIYDILGRRLLEPKKNELIIINGVKTIIIN